MTSTPASTPTATTITWTLPKPFWLQSGAWLREVTVAAGVYGTLNRARDNCVLVQPGISGDTHMAATATDRSPGWWEPHVGPGRTLDTRELCVVTLNYLGSCFGTTGPTAREPLSGEPYGPTFPLVTPLDQARLFARVLFDPQGPFALPRLRAFIGYSLGAMVGLAWATEQSARTDCLLVVSAPGRATPHAQALHQLQRLAIVSDPAYQDGRYPIDDPTRWPAAGLALARQIGMTSYRGEAEFAHRFEPEAPVAEGLALGTSVGELAEATRQGATTSAVAGYLAHHGAKQVGRFDPNAYLVLSHAMDLFDLAGADRQDCLSHPAAGVSRITCATTIAGVPSDRLYPIALQRALADTLQSTNPFAQFRKLRSVAGHDAFLVAHGNVAKLVDAALRAPRATPLPEPDEPLHIPWFMRGHHPSPLRPNC